MAADEANSTPTDGSAVEPALIYDGGERRTHDEHAAEAYDFAQRADALQDMADAKPPFPLTAEEASRWADNAIRHYRAADACRARAQWHATMATYHAIVD